MKKGISPLIAAVLLIAFTMTIAGLVGPFFTDIMTSTQESQDEKAENLLESSRANIEIAQSRFDSSSGNYTLTLQNKGQTELENFTATVYGDSPSQKRISQRLGPGEIHTFTVETNSTQQADRISVASEEMAVSAEKDLENSVTGSAPAAPTGLTLS